LIRDILRDMAAAGIDTLVVENYSRLARDLFVQEYLVKKFEDMKLKIASAQEMYEGDDRAMRDFTRQILGAVWQYEKRRLVDKLRAARHRVGRLGGQPGFGSKPGEAEALALMRELRAQGRTYQQIADALTERGAATRHRRRWHANSVRRSLLRRSA
jgi:DNA invertase Pin-like site-specific DNA recombinase